MFVKYEESDCTIQLHWRIYRDLCLPNDMRFGNDVRLASPQHRVLEDFSRAHLWVWIVGGGDKRLLEYELVDGEVVATVPNVLTAGVYGVYAFWVKDSWSKRMLSEVRKVFAITDDEEEASEVDGDTCIIHIESNSASYGYDGISAYEKAVMLGITTLTENEWIEACVTSKEDLAEQLKQFALKEDYVANDELQAKGLQYFLGKVDINGNPIIVYSDEDEWVSGKTYLHEEYNNVTCRWETSDTWHEGSKWRCLVHQPRMVGGSPVYDEPKWNNSSWKLIEGSSNLFLGFYSSNGYQFRAGSVSTTITPHLFFGYEEISDDVADYYWSWKRCEQRNWNDGNPTFTPLDEIWNAQHEHTKELSLTDSDMPVLWSPSNKAIFILTVEVSDGSDTQYISNHVIA